jgi:biopolymer transport protein ExbB/TolQ
VIALWRWIKAVPKWIWGVLAAAGTIALVYLRGQTKGRITERLERAADDARLAAQRLGDLTDAQKRSEAAVKKAAEQAAQRRIEAKKEADRLLSQPPTAEQVDELIEEAKTWPDD